MMSFTVSLFLVLVCTTLVVSKPLNRITNGQTARMHQFPWQAAVYSYSGTRSVFCGGSLIDPGWVMTAAHCVDGFSSFQVILGAHRLTNASEETRQKFDVDEEFAFVHPEWNSLLLINDVALLKLPKNADINDFVKPIQVTNGSAATEASKHNATVSGWGLLSDSAVSISEYLQYISQPIITNMECSLRYFGVVQDSHICISGRMGMSTCNGDSGGPLIAFDENNVPKQIGIVSFGISLGCEVGWPPVFTRVSKFLGFIMNMTDLTFT